MTNLSNFSIRASYPDVLTCDGDGAGLTPAFQPVCDGNGNASPLQISLTSVQSTSSFTVGTLLLLTPQTAPPAAQAGGMYFDGSHFYVCITVTDGWVELI